MDSPFVPWLTLHIVYSEYTIHPWSDSSEKYTVCSFSRETRRTLFPGSFLKFLSSLLYSIYIEVLCIDYRHTVKVTFFTNIFVSSLEKVDFFLYMKNVNTLYFQIPLRSICFIIFLLIKVYDNLFPEFYV